MSSGGNIDLSDMGKYDFSDVAGMSDGPRLKEKNTCRMKISTGFILMFLALLVAAGVGLIVHFAENRKIECNFPESSPISKGSSTQQQTQKDQKSCKTLVQANEDKICDMCPVKNNPQTYSPTKAAQTVSNTVEPTSTSALEDIRLPKHIVPLHYDLSITPHLYGADPSQYHFNGTVGIRLQCKNETNKIILHTHKLSLTFDKIRLSSENNDGVVIAKASEDQKRQFLILNLNKELTKGQNYNLKIDFTGKLDTDLKGFYLSSYMENGTKRYLATTQFQPTDARKAFPCFDEPEFKASFNITIGRHSDWTSLSNTKVVSTTQRKDGFVEDHYGPTPKMSTYLVAFVVSKFKSQSRVTKNGLKYSVWSRPDALQQTTEALDVGSKVITFYEEYFNISFPLPKQDMIAIPDYPLGAMENWGLITYRETAMLYDPELSTEFNRAGINNAITHELSHQWFGDLVTTKWWDDLWLNEGFATFVEYMGTDYVKPEWKMLEKFPVLDMYDALEYDGVKSSHPIYVPVENPDQINEIFDKISYSKGGSVIRMIRYVIGEETFRQGLIRYLKKLKYGSAVHEDLWQSLQEVVVRGRKYLPFTVKEIMDTWILQMNYPVVKATKLKTGIRVEQKRFLLNKDSNAEERFTSRFGYIWKIPIIYTTSSELDFNKTGDNVTWLVTESKDIDNRNIPTSLNSWILVNPQQYGVYRVNYDIENWNALVYTLKHDHQKIPVINRGQLINDAWNLVKAKELPVTVALDIFDYLNKEMDYVPWSAAKRELAFIDNMMSKTEKYGEFQNFVRRKVTDPFKKFGLDFKNMTHDQIYSASVLVGIACAHGIDLCTSQAKVLFKRWMDNPDVNKINPNIKATVYCTGVAEGGIDEWTYVFNRYKKETVATEVSLLQSALSCTKETWILNKLLQMTSNPEQIRKQDAPRVIMGVARNPVGKYLAKEFFYQNWNFIRDTYAGGFGVFIRLVKAVTESFNTEYDLQQLKSFLSSGVNLGPGARAFDQAVENTESNIQWMKTNYDAIDNWLSNQAKGHIEENVRMPLSLIPKNYNLTLKPDFYSNDPSTFSSSGSVSIEMDCVVYTYNITLHVVDLVIDQQTVKVRSTEVGGAAPGVTSIEMDKEREFLIINLDGTLLAGKSYTLDLSFTGPLSNEVLAGMYVSSYQREDQTIYLVTTQFESTDARRAFPCFDEPELKAKFKVTLMRKPDKISLSNMPLEQTSVIGADGYVADEYAISPNMSTYLLAFIICDFKYTEKTTKNNIKYRAWATPETVDQTALALKTGADTLTYYEQFFGIKFPIPKQDMIAIPDFAAGAMENWGLITYRETAMLYDPDVSSASNQQRVVVVIAHELAHQWFGNLVTMDWWDDLWLNEGFATFVEYLGTDNLYPEWKMFDQFSVAALQEALASDGLVTSHPVYVPVSNPSEITEIFDAISYSKGGSIIRMMRFFLGDDTFAKGLTGYLTSRQFSNAFHDDLWNAMTKQAKAANLNIDVKAVMDTWILQMNYPVVMVTRANGKYRLQQKRFLYNPNAPDPGKYPSPFNYKWKIPFTVTSSDIPNFDQTFRDVTWIDMVDDMSIPTTSSGWFVANVQQYGYYRVNYDDENWQALIEQLKQDHKKIHIINRGQIINDVWALSKSGDVGILTALEVVDYLVDELDYVPWSAASTELAYVDDMLKRTPIYGNFQKYMSGLVSQAFDHYGLDNNNATHLEAYSRTVIASKACGYDITSCKTAAVNMFSDYMTDPKNYRIDPDLRSTVYCTGIAEGGQEEWDFLYQQYKLSNVASEKSTILSSLTCTKEVYLLSRFLSYSLDPSEVRGQDASSVIVGVSKNDNGRDLAWDFVLENWNTIIEKLGKGISTLRRIFLGLTVSFNTETDLQKLKDFKSAHPDLGSGTRAFEQAEENVQTNIAWMAKNYQTLEAWLDRKFSSQTKGSKRVTDVRLPGSIIPDLYTIDLLPNIYEADPKNFKILGNISIDIDCIANTDNITIHINKLNIDRASIKIVPKSGNQPVPVVVKTTEDKTRQFYIMFLNQNLTAGQHYKLSMSFDGPLKDDLAGLYYSTYKRNGKNVYLAVTQFEATDARKAFPCFDEPNLKAKFKVTLIRKPDMVSLSNMPQINTGVKRSDGFVADVYDVSEKMSTYLLAFIVCDFGVIKGKTKNNITYGIWSTKETIHQGEFALKTGMETITFYEDFFGNEFPLPKQDMIAIPDFSAGAMENWGLITYRETSLLYEPDISSEGNKQRVAEVIAHELAHQWFGDLVTMDWWDDLWLNEGFARFVQFLGTDHIFPEWKMFEQFVTDTLYTAFNFDGLVTSHPIYVPVHNPDEINEIFDSISYDKGASVIRMMKFFLGDSTFKIGLKNYLTERKFKNAFHNDLWNAMTKQLESEGRHIDVKAVMDTWTLQMNYPVVMVTVMPNGHLRLTQERFLVNPDSKDPGRYKSPFNYQWKIPFSFTTSSEQNFNKGPADVMWLSNKTSDTNTSVTLRSETDWIIGNVQQFGVYRVNYEVDNWLALIRQLKTDHKAIHPINRAQIINDAWNLAKSGHLDIGVSLKTVEYIENEMDYVPWDAANSQLSYVGSMLSRTELYGKFKRFIRKIVTKPFNIYSRDSNKTGHLDSFMRSILYGLACDYDLESCSKMAAKMFNDWMRDPENNRVDPGLKSTVYCSGVASGGEAEWNFVYQRYQTATVASERSRLRSALSCTKQTWILNKFLQMAMDPNKVRKQDMTGVISGIHGNPIGRDLVYTFINSNWDDLFDRYGGSPFSMKSLINTLATGMNSEFDLKRLKEFQRTHPNLGTGQRSMSQAIEKTQANIKWMKRYYSIIEKWLDENLETSKGSDYRLSRSIVPSAYQVELFPDIYRGDPADFKFTGSVMIHVVCMEDTSNFTLNSRQLKIDEQTVKIMSLENNRLHPEFLSLSYNEEQQLVAFNVRNQFVQGSNYSIQMNFTGPLLDDLQGLYYSSYKQNNVTRYLATTQFESIKARKAFPCFDEPDLKATFKITLIRHKDKISLSNMPIKQSVIRPDGYVADEYKETPIMSTYLLAFIVGDFNMTSNVTKRGVKYSVYSRPESVEQTRFALDVGVQVLTYYEDYFNVTFPLPKQDMVAIPDFGPGAMENWGLITYKERYLLYEDGVTSETSKQRTASVIAHELGHQWFGNLVTMKWWDDLWLNEGFATFMEYLGTDHVFKNWRMFDQMIINDLHVALDFDGLLTSHPIYVPLHSMDDLGYIFDSISYSKGGSVIRMARFFLGEDTFRKGLTMYLNKLKYQNADHNDLSSAWNQQAKMDNLKLPADVKTIMDTWLVQMNYPVVMVTATVDGKITATQKRFLHNPEAKDPKLYTSPYNYKWYIPLTITSSKEKNFTKTSDSIHWFNESIADFMAPNIPAEDGTSWILGNVGQYGFYRVNYTEQNWRAITNQLNTDYKVITPVNRAQLIDDAWSFSRANQLDTGIALSTLEYLNKEMDFIVRSAANKQLSFLDKMLSTSIYYGKFKNVMRKFVKDGYNKFGLNSTHTDHVDLYMQSLISEKACDYDLPECVNEAKRQFKDWINNPNQNRINPNIRSTVYCTAIRTGGEAEWDFTYSQYKKSTVATEIQQLLTSLSCTEEPWIIQRFLQYTLTPTEIRKQETAGILKNIAGNKIGRSLVWDLISAKWDFIDKDYLARYFNGGIIIKELASVINTEYQLQQLIDLKSAITDLGRAERDYNQAMETAQSNIKWTKNSMNTVEKWLNKMAV